jgi:hypothetical protein
MISFEKPKKLDGQKLISELQSGNIEITPNGIGAICPVVDGSGVLWLDISSADKESAKIIIQNHQG